MGIYIKKMKRFGFHPNQLYFNLRNPNKVNYVHTKRHGNFEVPKVRNTTNVNELAQNYEKRLDFEKYMNPKGLKPTITSRFPKEAQDLEFVNHDVKLMRSSKPYNKN